MPLPAYTLHLGPLDFICPLEQVTKTLGDAVDTVGAAVTPAERRPRPLKLKLPVEGDPHTEADPKVYGDRLERALEELLENRRWLSHGLYLHWEVGDHLAAWVILAGGDLREQDPGISFGMYELELELYVVGAPGAHRMGRRLDLADRRSGLVPCDTRGLLYTDDFADATLPDKPLILPAQTLEHRSSARVLRDSLLGEQRTSGAGADSRWPWAAWEAVDGEVITFMPERFATSLNPLAAPRLLEDFGAVKAWDMNSGFAGDDTTHPPFRDTPLATAINQDYTPEASYGWTRLYGRPRAPDRYIALENGTVRLRWVGRGTGAKGTSTGQGLIFEWWDESYPGGARYRPEGRFHPFDYGDGGHSNTGVEVTLVELTLERGILEVRHANRCLRVILQRGWTGPRLEVYCDLIDPTLGTAYLTWEAVNPNSDDSFITQDAAAPFDFVRSIYTNRDAPDTQRAITVAPAADTYLYELGASNLSYDYGAATISQPESAATPDARGNLVVVQIGGPFPGVTGEHEMSTPEAIGALSLVDARSVPVLVSR